MSVQAAPARIVRTVADLLPEEEVRRVQEGHLVVTTSDDQPLTLDATVLPGQSLVLRAPLTLSGLEAAGHNLTLLYGFLHYCENCGGIAFGFMENRCFHAPGGSATTAVKCVRVGDRPAGRTLAEKLHALFLLDMEHLQRI